MFSFTRFLVLLSFAIGAVLYVDAEAVGCDHFLGSGARKDRCGICDGNGETCILVRSSYQKDALNFGYSRENLIAVLPVGTTNAIFKQRKAGYNSLAIKDHLTGQYIIHPLAFSKTVYYNGSTIKFKLGKRKNTDFIFVDGPTNVPLRLTLIYLNASNQGVAYQYYRRLKQGEDLQRVPSKWTARKWSVCSATCGQEVITRKVSCVRSDDGTPASVQSCSAAIRPTSNQKCSSYRSCTPEWHLTDSWSECSKTCGSGTQSRLLSCRKQLNESYYVKLDESSCDRLSKPSGSLSQRCNEIPCAAEWKTLPWSECSKTCGTGLMTRKLECVRTDKQGHVKPAAEELCQSAVKPPTEAICRNDKPCETPAENKVACFIGANNLQEVLGDFTKEIQWDDTDEVVKKCADLAHAKDYKLFALGKDGLCLSGPDTRNRYYISGTDNAKCRNGIGMENSMFVYAFERLPSLQPVGCYYDNLYDRALPVSYANFRDQIIWSKMELTVNQCARVAYDKGYEYFAVQYYGECWGGKDAGDTYAKHGKSEDCMEFGEESENGVGGEMSNFVYRIRQK